MVEEIKNTSNEEAKPTTEQTPDIVTRAETILAEIKERENKAIEREKNAMEREARLILGGQSQNTPLVQQKEETPKEYKDRIMRGGI